jgi:hypothetical protein
MCSDFRRAAVRVLRAMKYHSSMPILTTCGIAGEHCRVTATMELVLKLGPLSQSAHIRRIRVMHADRVPVNGHDLPIFLWVVEPRRVMIYLRFRRVVGDPAPNENVVVRVLNARRERPRGKVCCQSGAAPEII